MNNFKELFYKYVYYIFKIGKFYHSKRGLVTLTRVKQLFTITFLVILFSGCSSFRGPLYPDVIYNNRQPLISVTYEYGEIQLILPLKYDAAVPENILFKVFAQGDTLHPVISILQEAPKEFLAYLPQGVLDIQNSTNLIKIIPQNKNFDPITVRLSEIICPFFFINPRLGVSKPAISLKRVVFPQPEGPSKPTNSPGLREEELFSNL